MNPATASGEWGAARWLSTVLGLTVLLGGSVKLLTRWPMLPPAREIPHPAYLFNPGVAGGVQGSEWLPDPMGFALADPDGFSGAAARLRPGQSYALAEFRANPEWLRMDRSGRRLGESVPLPPIQPRPDRLPVPAIPLSLRPAPLVPTNTVVTADPSLAGRSLREMVAVVPPSGEVLPAAVVEVAVNPWGQVVVARLVDSSGSPAADRLALSAARSARFDALSGRLKSEGSVFTELQWGRLTFNWGGGLALR